MKLHTDAGRSCGVHLRTLLATGLVLILSACGSIIPSTSRPPAASRPPMSGTTTPPAKETETPSRTGNAVLAGVRAGPSISTLGLSHSNAAGALASFKESCPRVTVRKDGSGLTRPDDWRQACTAAVNWGAGSPQLFFTSYFETAQVSAGNAHATGYYEPEILGSRTPRAGYNAPVYAMPSDLVRARAGDATPLPSGRMPLGRYGADGRFIPYFDRSEINAGALAGRGLEIAWAADPVELFFLQVQGSGRLVGPDGTVTRIGYAGQNGHAYTGIGGVMRDRGLVGSGPGQYSGSMQGIMKYLRERPEEGRALMAENRSWVFFKILNGDGPLGALNVPVRARQSVAADPLFVPLGAPVWLDLDRKEANGLWVAQDTGGAIKGANRFDTFWGAGSSARLTAGGMSGRGKALIFLPKGTLSRLGVR